MIRTCAAILGVVLVLSTAHAEETSTTEEVASGNRDLVSFDYRNEDIRVVLRGIADAYDLNLVFPQTLVGRTSLELRNVSWRQALDVVLTPLNYTYVEHGRIVHVVSRDSLTQGTKVATPGAPAPDSVIDTLFSWRKGVIVFAVAVTAFCNLCLSLGVLLSKPPEGTRFVPRFVWALLMIVGGVPAAAGYWLIHYSNLNPRAQGSEGAGNRHESS